MPVSVARRPLLTAIVAGALLCVLWFVPSAHGTAEQPGLNSDRTGAAQQLRLTETGDRDTIPYLVAGAGVLAVGVGLVGYAVRQRGPVQL
ncbi:hypothetical protein [Streptomyces sp. NPDC020965]|uniref:hypothetical protein n=1 Tax=Streptomyces sp. NPDC020965 TaxID=3365105 RepID=UPI0037A47A67